MNMKRNLTLENKFKAYLFKGDLERFKEICGYLGIVANINVFNKEMKGEAEVLNDIENRIRENQPITEREKNLLLESYKAFDIEMPQDIYIKLKGGLN